MAPAPPTAYTAIQPPMPPPCRPYSIAVFGCTGNAGRAVAYHVVKSAILSASTNHRRAVALAGRSRDKVMKTYQGILDELRQDGTLKSGLEDDTNGMIAVEIVVADALDEKSMLALASSSHILVSCAGPYGRYGESAVKACVDSGTHYVDITGEVDFIENMIHKYGDRAETNGVTLCPFSGYDCVPSELGMWLVGKALENFGCEVNNGNIDDGGGSGGKDGGGKVGGLKLGALEMNFYSKGGGFPRGTLLTLLDGADKQKQSDKKEKEENSVDDEVKSTGRSSSRFYPKEYRPMAKEALSPSHFLLPKYQLGQYTGPNFMSIVNVPVLCRAAPTLGFSSFDLTTISDRLSVVGRGSFLNGYYGLIQAQVYIMALVAGGVVFAFPQFRTWLRNKIETYNFHGDPSSKVFVDVRGTPSSSHGRGGRSTTTAYAMARCVYPGDPGIYATGFFAAGVANALLEATSTSYSDDRSDNNKVLAGFHSPIAALHGCRPGLLVEHLRQMGAEIKLEIVPEKGLAVKEIDVTKLRSKL